MCCLYFKLLALLDNYHPRCEGGIVFSTVRLCACLFVCLSVNTITREALEMSSRNFLGICIVLVSNDRTISKTAVMVCTSGDKTSLVF